MRLKVKANQSTRMLNIYLNKKNTGLNDVKCRGTAFYNLKTETPVYNHRSEYLNIINKKRRERERRKKKSIIW